MGGKVTYVPEEECLKWDIKQFNGQKEYLMRAHFGLPSIAAGDAGQLDENRKAPIRVKFEIPYFTVSGIQVPISRLLKSRAIRRCRGCAISRRMVIIAFGCE